MANNTFGAVGSVPYNERGGKSRDPDGQDRPYFPAGTGAGLWKGTNTAQPHTPLICNCTAVRMSCGSITTDTPTLILLHYIQIQQGSELLSERTRVEEKKLGNVSTHTLRPRP